MNLTEKLLSEIKMIYILLEVARDKMLNVFCNENLVIFGNLYLFYIYILLENDLFYNLKNYLIPSYSSMSLRSSLECLEKMKSYWPTFGQLKCLLACHW